MKSLICFKVGKKVSNSNETKEQVEQLLKKTDLLLEQLQERLEQLETASGGEIETDSKDFMEFKGIPAFRDFTIRDPAIS